MENANADLAIQKEIQYVNLIVHQTIFSLNKVVLLV